MTTPHEKNETVEVSELTNSDFRHFTAGRRIDVDLGTLPFVMLNDLFAEGEAYLSELADLKDQELKRKLRSSGSPKGGKRKDQKIRETQPW